MASAEDLKVWVNLAAVAKPGDTILLGFGHTLTDRELSELQEQFEDFTEKTGVHVAVVENVTSMVVSRGR